MSKNLASKKSMKKALKPRVNVPAFSLNDSNRNGRTLQCKTIKYAMFKMCLFICMQGASETNVQKKNTAA